MMIKLSDELYVASDQIASIEINSYRTGIIVTMKDGQRYSYEIGYNKSVFKTLDELATKINGAQE